MESCSILQCGKSAQGETGAENPRELYRPSTFLICHGRGHRHGCHWRSPGIHVKNIYYSKEIHTAVCHVVALPFPPPWKYEVSKSYSSSFYFFRKHRTKAEDSGWSSPFLYYSPSSEKGIIHYSVLLIGYPGLAPIFLLLFGSANIDCHGNGQLKCNCNICACEPRHVLLHGLENL